MPGYMKETDPYRPWLVKHVSVQ